MDNYINWYTDVTQVKNLAQKLLASEILMEKQRDQGRESLAGKDHMTRFASNFLFTEV